MQLVRRAICQAGILLAFTKVPNALPAARAVVNPIDAIQAAREADLAETMRLREQAVQPNKYGRFETLPPPSPPPVTFDGFNGERGMDFTGRLAPEYEGDTRERYSNPSAARLAQASQEAAARRQQATPMSTDTNIRRTGYFSVQPANMQCDANGRNCKFTGAAGGAATSGATTRGGDVPDGKFLREDLELLKRGL